jgi:hypothetical protein
MSLAAKPPVSSVLGTLLTARKVAFKGSRVSYNAPRIVYLCVDLSRRGEQRRYREMRRSLAFSYVCPAFVVSSSWLEIAY